MKKTTPRRLTPDGLAALLAKMQARGIPVERATLSPDGTLDLLLTAGENRDDFDLVDMKR